jgi:hypothetical protein
MPKFYSSGVLAGAYRDLKGSAMLSHAVSEGFSNGRLVRAYGEAMCSPKLNMGDSGIWEDVSYITCPKCIVERQLLLAYPKSVYGDAPNHWTWTFDVFDKSSLGPHKGRGVL